MKITNVITDSNVGGAGVLLASICEALGGKFNIEVLLPRGSKLIGRLSGSGATVREMDISPERSFNGADTGLFFRYFRKNPTDIVHTHASLSARLGAKAAGIPVTISTRHCARDRKELTKKSLLQRTVYNYCTDLTVSTADHATLDLTAEGIPRERIITIKNGVLPRRSLPPCEISRVKRELMIPEGARVIGAAARLEWIKGLDLIIRAMTILCPKHPDLYLCLVGEGSAKASLARLAATLGVLPRVRFVGYREDVTPYQNIFYVNVNSSRGTETSCLATSECMSLSIPTVASDFGGNTEMIIHEKNGLIFPRDSYHALADALSRLLRDTDLYLTLCQGAREIYQSTFSLEGMAKRYEAMYLSLRKRGAPKG